MSFSYYRSFAASLVFALAWLAGLDAKAVTPFSVSSPTNLWKVVPYPSSTVTDYALDQQTGSGEADIVGGGFLPSFYTNLVSGSTSTNGTLYFRVRLGADDNPAGFKAACFLRVDANGDGKLDLFFGVNNSGSSDGIFIWKAGSGANISPSTTSIDNTHPVQTYSITSSNYLWTPVTSTIDPDANTPALLNVDGRTGSGQNDYFLTFAIPFADIVAAFNSQGITVDSSTALAYVVGTSTQANAFKQDLNGVNGSVNSSQTWASLGAISSSLNATGVAIAAPPAITSANTASGTAGSAFSYQIAATNTPGSYNATGLPAGLTVNTSTGVISGTPTVAGDFTVTITATNAQGTGSGTVTISLAKMAQTITFAALANATYGDAAIALSATASSGLAVSYSVVSGPASLSGNTLTMTGAGSVTVRASQPGNSNYLAAANVDRTFSVAKAPLMVTAADKSKLYGAANPTFTASYSGFVNSQTLGTSGVTGSPALSTTATTSSPTGTYPITAAAGTLTASNYAFSFTPGTLTVGKAAQTITFPAIADVTYGATAITPTATASSSLAISYSVVSGPATMVNGMINITGAGTVVVRASQAGDSTYDAATDVDRTFAVAKATLTVTADNASKLYGAANPTFTASYSGFVNSQTLGTSGVTGSPALSTTATTSSPTGTYPITAAAGTLTASNYAFSFTPGTLTVGKAAQTITFPAIADVTYGTTAITPTATASSSLAISYSVVSGPATMVNGMINITGAGTVVVRASQAGDSTYEAATDVDRTFAVAKATLTVTADNANKLYGAANPTFTASYSGFVNSQTLGTSGVTGSPALSTTATTSSPTGTYPITAAAGTLTASNYAFSFTPGTLTVGKAAQTITFPAIADVTYGTTAITPTATASSSLAISYSVVSGPATMVNGMINITGAGTVVVRASQAGDSTYDAATDVDRTFAVAKATLTVTADNANKLYGAANPTFTASYSGFVNSQTLGTSGVTGSPALSTTATQTSAAGNYAITASTGTLAAANYQFTFTAGTLAIGFVNQAPFFTRGADVQVDEDAGAQTIANFLSGISPGASDESSQKLTIESSNTNGTLFAVQPHFALDGTLTFTPARDAHGLSTVSVRLHDDGGTAHGGVDTSAIQTFTITVVPVNDAPVAVTDLAATTGENPVTINVIANDTDVDGDAIIFQDATLQSGRGKVEKTASGEITFTPAAGFHGTAVIAYEIADAGGARANGLCIVAVNGAPQAVADTATTAKNVAVSIPVLANDGDPDGDALAITSITLDAAFGQASVAPGGQSIVFTPAADLIGTVQFSYLVGDQRGGFAQATVTVKIGNDPAADLPPVTTSDKATTAPGASVSIAVLSNDYDPEGGALTLESATVDPAFGTLSLVGNNVVFQPAPGFEGTALIRYHAQDVAGNSSEAVAIVEVTAGAAAPIALDDHGTAQSGVAKNFSVLQNDLSPSGATLSVTQATLGNPGSGTVAVNPDYTVRFQPAGNFTGTVEIVYTVQDTNGRSAQAKLTVQVLALVQNTAPVAANDTAFTQPGQPVDLYPLANDVDEDGDALTVTNLSVPVQQGTAVLAAGGKVVFTPAPGFAGVATVHYHVADPNGGESEGVITITVNTLPIAAPDVQRTAIGTPITFNVLANDSDPDGQALHVVAFTNDPALGTFHIATNGVLTFSPAPAFIGPASFTYTLADDLGAVVEGNILITVSNPPIARDDAVSTDVLHPITVNVLGNDSETNGGALRIVAATVDASQGTVTIQSDGTLLFTPASTFQLSARIHYLVMDSQGNVADAYVTIQRMDAPPSTKGRTVYGFCDVPLSINALRGATDADGDALRIIAVTQGSHGKVKIGADGYVTYLPTNQLLNNPTAHDQFTVTVDDGKGGTSTLTITVASFNGLKGAYQALITAPQNAPTLQISSAAIADPVAGMLRMQLGNAATFTGALQLGTQRASFAGRLSGSLGYEGKLRLKGYPNARLKLTFQPDSQQFAAEILGTGQQFVAAEGLRIAARRLAGTGQSFRGKFGADLQLTPPNALPIASGKISILISKQGTASYRITLSNGQVLSGRTHLFSDGQMPIYAARHATDTAPAGAVGGMLRLNLSGPAGEFVGTLQADFGTAEALELTPTALP